MKKSTYLIVAMMMWSLLAQAQFTNNFESGDRNIDAANCWLFFGTSINSNDAISGTYSTRSGQASSLTSKKEVISPYLDIAAGSVITFKHKIENPGNLSGNPRYLDVVLVDANGNDAFILLNQFTYTNGSVQNANITVGQSGIYRVAMRHYGSGGNSRGHIDDFSITNATYASDPSNNCQPLVSNPDADGDGVADGDDAFPNDASRAYISEYPANGVFATIAFEDLWPALGDYDFNDLVVDYHLNYVLNANNEVVDIDGDYYIRAVGGTLARGVGIHFPGIAASAVSSVSGQQLFGNVINGSNGTEQGQSNAVVIINDDVEQVINRVGGTFYNSIKGEPVGQSDSINVVVTFTNPVAIAQASDFSVFMFKKAGRGQEIHLPDHEPTDLADQSLFGTVDDDTQPGSGRYYKSPNNLPWALELPQRFDYPDEKRDLVQTYLKFAAWAQSSGGTFTDWYEDKADYRAPNNLFE